MIYRIRCRFFICIVLSVLFMNSVFAKMPDDDRLQEFVIPNLISRTYFDLTNPKYIRMVSFLDSRRLDAFVVLLDGFGANWKDKKFRVTGAYKFDRCFGPFDALTIESPSPGKIHCSPHLSHIDQSFHVSSTSIVCLASFEDAVRQLREVKNRICRDARGVYMEELAFGNLAFEIHTDPSMPCDWKILLRVDALHEGLYSFKLDMWRRQCQPTHNTDTEPVSVEVDI